MAALPDVGSYSLGLAHYASDLNEIRTENQVRCGFIMGFSGSLLQVG